MNNQEKKTQLKHNFPALRMTQYQEKTTKKSNVIVLRLREVTQKLPLYTRT